MSEMPRSTVKLFTTGKAVLSIIFAALLAAIPIMVEKTPLQVYAGLKPWFPVFYGLAVGAGIFAVFAFGFSRGRSSKELRGDLNIVVTPASGRSIKDLKYATNQIASILMEHGMLRRNALEAQYPTLERKHEAWHNDEARIARDDLMAFARHCHDLRVANWSGRTGGIASKGDFKQDEREKYTAEIEKRRDRLLEALDTIQ